MLQLFKKLFFLKIFSKKIFLVFSIFSLFILFCPLSPIHAFGLTDIVLFLPSALVTFLLEILLLLGEWILRLGNWLLSWAISNPFDVDFTNPAGNPIIKVGWTLLRDITNMFFILGLAYIGLATALDWAGFETKKIFGRLILIALIINFTPVICGAIVDISNILANFFLKGINFDSVIENYSIQRGVVKSHWANLLTDGGALLSAICLVVYGFLGAFVFLLFALLFLVRYLAIWILVILSPLAFFTWIFPKTRGKIWDMWWNQFLQWSFVIIPASFFLYLSQHILANIDKFTTSYPGDPTGGVFLQIAPYFVALLFLIFGYLITLQTSAMGAGATIGFGKKIRGRAGVAGKWVGKKSIKGVGKVGEGIAGGVIGGASGAKEEKGVWGKIKGAAKGGFTGTFTREGREKGREKKEKILEKAHVVRPGFYEEKRKKRWKIDEEAKKLEILSSGRLHEITKRKAITTGDVRSRMAAFETLTKRRKLKDEEKELIPQAKAFGVDTSEVDKARPDWAPITQSEAVEKLIREQNLTDDEAKKEVIKQQVEGRSPRQFRQETQPDALKNTDVFTSMDVAKISDIGIRGTAEQKKAIEEVIKTKMGEIDRKYNELIAEGKEEEAARIGDLLDEIDKNPNFST